MTLPDKRLSGIDALKGLAGVMIVWHHLAFYGPMSDVIHPLVPGLTGRLIFRRYCRLVRPYLVALAAFLLSLLAGMVLYRGVESRRVPSPGAIKASAVLQ